MRRTAPSTVRKRMVLNGCTGFYLLFAADGGDGRPLAFGGIILSRHGCDCEVSPGRSHGEAVALPAREVDVDQWNVSCCRTGGKGTAKPPGLAWRHNRR